MSSAASPVTIAPVPYSPSVEVKQPEEDKISEEIMKAMVHIDENMTDRYRHSYRAVHAKSHALLKAELKVSDNLPPTLQQGIFAVPGATYPVIIRMSTNPGDMLSDDVSTPRGFAVKVLNVPGERLPGNADSTTQDFVNANGKSFPNKNAAEFLGQIKQFEATENLNETFKKAVSTTARATNAVLGALGHESAHLKGLGHPFTNPLGETFGTQVPIRFGDYVAKLVFAPQSDNLKALTDKPIDSSGFTALRDVIQEFFNTETAVWEVQVQLNTDLEKMPIEDASVEWSEEESPYITVGTLTALSQHTYSPARRVYVDDVLAFNPWNGLAAHQPLGNVMRARKAAYDASITTRRAGNAIVGAKEPTSISELPD